MRWTRFALVSMAAWVLGAGGAGGARAGEERGLPPSLRAVLAGADVLDVVSLDPHTHRAFGYGEGSEAPKPLERWQVALAEADGVFGRVQVSDPATRRALLEGLEAGLAQPGPPAGCYDPRHALVARKGDVTVAVHLCFACNFALLLEAGMPTARLTNLGDPKGLQARLNALLKAADVPLAPPIGSEPKTAPVPPDSPLATFEAPDALTLYAIDENVYRDAGRGEEESGAVHVAQALELLASGKGVRSSVTLTRPSARAALLHELRRGFAMPGEPAECYNPRHAVVLRKDGLEAVAFLCFECSYGVVAHAGIAGPHGLRAFGDPGRLQARLDMILAHAGAAPARFDLLLTAVGEHPIAVVKVVRELTGLGLKEANDLVQRAPSVVLSDLERGAAQAALERLTGAGASAAMKARPK